MYTLETRTLKCKLYTLPSRIEIPVLCECVSIIGTANLNKPSLNRSFNVKHRDLNYPLARRFAPREGANIDRRLVPYHGKCMRIQSHIEFMPKTRGRGC